MKISIAVAVLILALAAGFGWVDHQRLAAGRESHRRLVAEAARLGIAFDLSTPAVAGRITKHPRPGREGAAKLTAEFIAFGKDRDAFEQAGGGSVDAAMQRQMYKRMTAFRERMLALDPAELQTLISELGTNKELTDRTRQRLIAVSLLTLSNDHPQAVLALFTESAVSPKDDMSGGYVIASSLTRWAKDDPQAALAWLEKNAGQFPDLITDNAERGMISGVAMQDPRLAFRLIGELGIKDAGDAMCGIVGVAMTPEEKAGMLVALREHLATLTDETARDEVSSRAVLGLSGSIIQGGFASASQWLATARLTPAELLGFADGVASFTASGGETGQWIEWIGATLPADKVDARIQNLISSWTRNDYQAAGTWLAATPEGPTRNTAIRRYAATVSSYEPETAAQWALTLPAGPERDATLRQIYRNWPRGAAASSAAAAAFAAQHGIE
jgi:hypothetical protein